MIDGSTEFDFGVIYVLFLMPKVGCAALFDVFVLGCVEVHDARIAELVSVLARHKAGCIVTAHLHVACSTWSSTVLFAVDCDLHRLDAAFEVSAYGRAVNHQQGILGGFTPSPAVVPNITGRR